MGLIKGLLQKFAKWLGVTVQGTDNPGAGNDYADKGNGLSIADNVSQAITPLVCWDYKWQVRGESRRAKLLDSYTTRFVDTQLVKTVHTCLNTGDVIAIPIMTHGKIITQLLDANGFNIIDAAGDELYEIQFVLDTFEQSYHTYHLLEDIKYDIVSKTCIYRLFVEKDGNISTNLSQVAKWSGYQQEWTIPNVERMLIGRMKSPTINPSNINNVKGVPLCFGAGDAISELKKLYTQIGYEFDSSEKFLMVDKVLLKTNEDDSGNKSGTPVLPAGRNRLYQSVNAGGTSNEGLIQEFAPEIRASAYKTGIEQQERLLEQSIGVNNGLISDSTTNYENVDNVRKSMQQTNSLIAAIRKQADSMMRDLLYAWDKLLNYYNITPMGDFDEIHDWSDEYITTFDSKRQQLLDGVNIGAISRAEYRQWVTGDSIEDAERIVAEINDDIIM